jgi:anti-sigma regulatory factor (Ser/Thr protein kinase)
VSEVVPRAVAAKDDAILDTRTFNVDRSSAGEIDEWIETAGRRWGQDQRTVYGARLCVAELVANVIEHGIARSGRDHIVVTLTRRSDGIGIEFMDSREHFDPTGVTTGEQPSSIDAVAINGRGLMLVRAYATELAYRNDGTYNRVTLKIASR